MAELWAKLKGSFVQDEDPEPQEEASLLQKWGATIDEATTLDRNQRFYGFLICVGMSLLFSALCMVTFFPIFAPTKFAVMYSFGNVFAIGSTMFLMGPANQARRMFEKGRWVATTIYLLSLALTLAAAFVAGSKVLVLLFLCIQMGALFWYCLSYVPFARGLVSRLFAWFVESEG